MIIKKARAKNFFSIGNDFLEIDIEKYRRSLISGVNGQGKSTMINMICFGLFGKTIKQINKPLIINSINNKNCVVEIELASAGKQYLIRRGIKPNVFEVFEDGVLLDQTLIGDYQDYLENEILHCTYRTFLQTSILSVENYKPFMALTASERRAFVEDILDIKVFSIVDGLVKSTVKKNKESIAVAEREVASIKAKGEVLKSAIEKIDLMNNNSTESLEQELKETEIELEAARARLETLQEQSGTFDATLSELRAKRRSRDELKSKGLQLKTKVESVAKTLDFFTKSDVCPTCTQPIDPNNVAGIVDTHTCEHTSYMTELKAIAKELQQYSDVVEKENEATEAKNAYVLEVSRENQIISSKEMTAKSLMRKIKEIKETATNSDDEKAKLAELVTEGRIRINELATLRVEQEYNTLLTELFKDTGIKSKIVDQYIPVINELINEYLDKMELFVKFELDAQFNESVKSRHRDNFTYNSFSAGEKARLDLAIMFTMRRLSVMRNSFSCNLLCADEVLDAAVDGAGVGMIVDILLSPEFDQTNLFIISHRNTEMFEDISNVRYNVYKRGDFTQVDELVLN